jgi:hypothetical protein
MILREGNSSHDFDALVSPNAAYQEQVYQLIDSAHRDGWLLELLATLLAERHDTAPFTKAAAPIYRQLLAGLPLDSATPAASASAERRPKTPILPTIISLEEELIQKLPQKKPVSLMSVGSPRDWATGGRCGDFLEKNGFSVVERLTLAIAVPAQEEEITVYDEGARYYVIIAPSGERYAPLHRAVDALVKDYRRRLKK